MGREREIRYKRLETLQMTASSYKYTSMLKYDAKYSRVQAAELRVYPVKTTKDVSKAKW